MTKKDIPPPVRVETPGVPSVIIKSGRDSKPPRQGGLFFHKPKR